MSSILRQTSYIFQHLSILRHDDDFDETTLIYGPATPYIPGVSEPEPEIPLRDSESSLTSVPRFNRIPHGHSMNASNRHQIHRLGPDQRMNPSVPQSSPVRERTGTMNIRNDTSVNTVQRPIQMQYQNLTLQQQAMPPPPLRCFPTNSSTNRNNYSSNNSHYPTMTVSSNSFRAQSCNVVRMTQNQGYHVAQSNRVPTPGPRANMSSQNTIPNSPSSQRTQIPLRYRSPTSFQRIAPAQISPNIGQNHIETRSSTTHTI